MAIGDQPPNMKFEVDGEGEMICPLCNESLVENDGGKYWYCLAGCFTYGPECPNDGKILTRKQIGGSSPVRCLICGRDLYKGSYHPTALEDSGIPIEYDIEDKIKNMIHPTSHPNRGETMHG